MNTSQTSVDTLNGPGFCGTGVTALPGVNPNTPHAKGGAVTDRVCPCWSSHPGPVRTWVDHTMTDQSSTIRFVEDNWLGGQRIGNGSFDTVANSIASMFTFLAPSTCVRTLILDDNTGEVVSKTCSFPGQ